VDHQDAVRAEFAQHPIHHRHQLLDATDRVKAVVRIPHVAHDDRRLAGRPAFLLLDDLELLLVGGRRRAAAQGQVEGLLGLRPTRFRSALGEKERREKDAGEQTNRGVQAHGSESPE
jgi:hypothetical protein